MTQECSVGPVTPASLATMKWKYAQPGEDWRAICNRVAFAATDNSYHYHDFRRLLLQGLFVPGGRILAGMGTTKNVTAANCYVSGTIPDSLRGIMERLKEGARTLQMGGGIGFDFSPIRPHGSLVRSLESRASGPVSFMRMYDAMGATISSAGERRGAMMAILRVDHPDIELFLMAKQSEHGLNTFNISIAVTDEFMHAVMAGLEFPLRFEGHVHRMVDARTLWEAIMRSTWDWAEPGVVFIDQMNAMNNLWYCETIAATNPCSEQPLPPHGACFLGAMNLPQFLIPIKQPQVQRRHDFDWGKFRSAVPSIVRAMDNIMDRTQYPLEQQKMDAMSKRRMGIGVMGLANCLEAQGFVYGTEEAQRETRKIMKILAETAYLASVQLAIERGSFPMFKRDDYLGGQFISRLSGPVRDMIAAHGIRNSHLLTVAPTGTTAFVMDNVSSGIEPVFAIKERRRVKTPEGDVEYDVEDYGSRALGVTPRVASEVSAEEHIDMLCAAQFYCDSAISKTCNVPSAMGWDQFKGLYERAWKGGAKGCATFTVGGQRGGIRSDLSADCEGDRCQLLGAA